MLPHAHAQYQWYACIHGGLEVDLDGRQFALAPQQSILVAPGTARALRCPRRAPGYVVLIFDPGDWDLAGITGRVLGLPPAGREPLRSLVAELRVPAAESQRLVAALVDQLLVLYQRSLAAAPATISDLNAVAQDGLVAAVDAYLRSHLETPVRRRDIAAAVHLSEPHLARLYRARTGTTLLGRLTGLRVEAAKLLLRESDRSVSQIAAAVGLPSFSHFARTFKRAVGVSPGDYRRVGGRIYLPDPP